MIPGDPRQPRVLVVDDERQNLQMLQVVLRNEGYVVDIAASGDAALDKSRKSPPDLVLLDIMMPGMDGFETLKELKSLDGLSGVPVIFLSGLEDLEAKLKGFSLGAVDYITKPFHIEEVRARVRIHQQLALARHSLVLQQAARLRSLSNAQKKLQVDPLDLPDARFSVWYESAEEAGGDIYDVVRVGDGIHGFLVADVSGHDVGTSLVASAARALFRQNTGPMYSPEETFQMVNRVLTGWLPPGRFLTACYALLNRNTGRLSVVGGAHPPAAILDASGHARHIEIKGDVLGAFSDARFARVDARVQPGDRVILYTDGLVESISSGRTWTADGDLVLRALERISDEPLEQLPSRLARELSDGGKEDDVLTLAFEV